jgi:two-component system NtrC family response regulator/two-component system nitrogen regulation response regulator GlnG
MAQILIVDDDAQLRQSFGKILEGEGFEVRAAPSGEAGVDEVAANPPDLVVMDVRMPGMTGIEAMQHMRASCPGLPVIIMTAYGGTETAIEATKLGAFDYILKPFDIPDILRLIGQALNAGRLARARVAIGPDEDGDDAKDDALVGQSRAMQEVFKAIGRAAPTDALVLVRGESGTGKELVARALWQHSARADKPFVVIKLRGHPETCLKASFSATRRARSRGGSRRVGKIEQAQRGTVFLDEIGDMPMNVQAKMLRLYAGKAIERSGRAVRPFPLTSHHRRHQPRPGGRRGRGQAAEDPVLPLKVVSVMLPPLRERTGDVPRLAAHFLSPPLARDGHAETPA